MQSLKELPAQLAALDTRMASLESQVLQSRAEMKGEFLAVRGIQSGDAGLLKEIRAVEGRLHKGHKQDTRRLASTSAFCSKDGLRDEGTREHEGR